MTLYEINQHIPEKIREQFNIQLSGDRTLWIGEVSILDIAKISAIYYSGIAQECLIKTESGACITLYFPENLIRVIV